MSKDFLPDDYTEVHERVEEFRNDYPKGQIATTIVKWEDGLAVFRAKICDEDGNLLAQGSGHATREHDKFVGEKFYEKGETVAVGRALAFAGYGIEKGIASQEEVQGVGDKEAGKDFNEKYYKKDQMSTADGSLTNKQTKAIFGILSGEYDLETEIADDFVGFYKQKNIEDLSKREASNLIDMLKKDEGKADKRIKKYRSEVEDE